MIRSAEGDEDKLVGDWREEVTAELGVWTSGMI